MTYPSEICGPCGRKHGRLPSPGHVATYYPGTCGWCGKTEIVVTEPRDWGYPRHEERKPFSVTASHPWEGKRVWRKNHSGKRLEGVVEVVRRGVTLPENVSQYNRPAIGTVIIRKIKKDGSPSRAYHPYENVRWWSLVEDETP